MCASLPATSISFDLYSCCPFEAFQFTGPELDVNVGAPSLTTPAPAGPSLAPPLPEFCGVVGDYSFLPDMASIRPEYELTQFDDWRGSLDATEWIPAGGTRAGQVHNLGSGSWFHAHTAVLRFH